MQHFSVPDTFTKLTQMGDVTLFEPAGDSPQTESKAPLKHTLGLHDCVAQVQTPKGPKTVMKSMMTTACERNCYYCPFRAGRGQMRRLTFTPDEMAKAFDTLQTKGVVDGLFLSSGIIKGSVTTQDKIIDTVEIVRRKYQYDGYVHLKIMPGVEYDQLYRAMQIADRVSVNLEGPTQQRLEALAPKKDFLNELITMLDWAEKIRREHPHEKLASTVTQFVVGAVGDTDLELLSVSERLYRQMRLARAYYSTFSPVEHTPFEDLPRGDTLREHRLYQASFLLRDYNWELEDLPLVGEGFLRTDVDPKRAWADEHLVHQPVDLMTAGREELMRVPGIGQKGAAAILNARRTTRLADAGQLKKLGIRGADTIGRYVVVGGRRLPVQVGMFG